MYTESSAIYLKFFTFDKKIQIFNISNLSFNFIVNQVINRKKIKQNFMLIHFIIVVCIVYFVFIEILL